ncbi:hypothetical protein GZH49_12165 [Nocardia terpenica]|uniref:hypothetical protein n=1 Tax=Nocardia terpenica TaxID=455432 RepID=UPI002FE04381
MMKILRIILTALVLVGGGIMVAHPAAAQTTDDCGKRNPPFPKQDSSKVERTVQTAVGAIPLRRGFYCVPKSAEGNEVAEATYGFGFGMDKVRYRHHITKIKVVEFPLKESSPRMNERGVYEFHATARMKRCSESGTDCEIIKKQPVIAVASTRKEDEYYGMPGGDPLGLMTFYCDYGDPTRLRCEPWVNTALSIFK